jgi:hypothetical protein
MMKAKGRWEAGVLLTLGIAVGLVLTAQAQTTGTDKAKVKAPDQTDAKVAPSSGLSALVEALKQVIESAEEERSMQRGVRAEAQALKANAKDAEIAAKREKLEHDVANAREEIDAIWESLLSKSLVLVAGTARGMSPDDPLYAEARKECQGLAKRLELLKAKVKTTGRGAGGGGQVEISQGSRLKLDAHMARIHSEAVRLRDNLSAEIIKLSAQPVQQSQRVVAKKKGRVTLPDWDALKVSIGGAQAIFRMEGGHLTVASSAGSAAPVTVPVTDGKVGRAALVDALKALGFSEAAILANWESIAGALVSRFGVRVV